MRLSQLISYIERTK